MTHYAHTPIPLDFMSEIRSMTEKSFTSVTIRPQDHTVSPVRVSGEVSAVCVGGQCRRSVSTRPTRPARPTRPSDRNRLFHTENDHIPGTRNGKTREKNSQYIYCMYTTSAISILYVDYSCHLLPFIAILLPFIAIYCHFIAILLPFNAIYCHLPPLYRRLLTVPAFIRRQSASAGQAF